MNNLLARMKERVNGTIRPRLRNVQGSIEVVSLRVRERARQLLQGTDGNNEFVHRVSQVINQVTGYETCERLKKIVQETDCDFQRLKDELYQARSTFDVAIQSRSQCQKDLNSLLQRKQTWSDEDLHRFTELYRREMRLEQGEAEAKASHQQLEAAVDRAHQRLMDALRERYQEEQLWSDKIRRVSTYGTVSLMALNLILFLLIQLGLEPRKRQRLLGRFDSMLEARLGVLSAELEGQRAMRQAQAMPTPIPIPDAGQAATPPGRVEERAAQAAIIGASLILLLSFGKWLIS